MLRDEVGVRAQPIVGASELDDHGMVKEAVEECVGDDRIAEDLAPFGEAMVAGEDHGAFFVTDVDQLEEQVGGAVGNREIADLVPSQPCFAWPAG